MLYLCILVGCGKSKRIGEANLEQVEVESNLIIEIPAEYLAEKHPLAGGFAGGDGTIENPYQISNAEQLTYWAETINNDDLKEVGRLSKAHYILADDIMFNDVTDFDNWSMQAPDYEWEAVGCNKTIFCGGFDGNGHTISGLYIVESGNEYQAASDSNRGAFISTLLGNGNPEEGGYVCNLTIDKSYYRCLEGTVGAAGIVQKVNKGTVENCEAKVIIDYQGDISSVGGIVTDSFEGDILDCDFAGEIHASGATKISGIVAHLGGGNIIGCNNNGILFSENQAYGIAESVTSITEFISTSTDQAAGMFRDMMFLQTLLFVIV